MCAGPLVATSLPSVMGSRNAIRNGRRKAVRGVIFTHGFRGSLRGVASGGSTYCFGVLRCSGVPNPPLFLPKLFLLVYCLSSCS